MTTEITKNGIISPHGIFIPCSKNTHTQTALRHDLNFNYVFCRYDGFYGVEIDIIGNLTLRQFDTIIDYCTEYNLKLEDICQGELEEQLSKKYLT